MGRSRDDRMTRHVATSKNAGTMTRMSVGMIAVANGLTLGVANHPMYGVASRLTYGAANHRICAEVTDPMNAGVNGPRNGGRTRAATGIVVAGLTHAPVMVPTSCCKTANAGLTSGADLTIRTSRCRLLPREHYAKELCDALGHGSFELLARHAEACLDPVEQISIVARRNLKRRVFERARQL